MKGGGDKQQQSVFPTFMFIFNLFSVEHIHKYIYVFCMSTAHILYVRTWVHEHFRVFK